MQIKNFYPGTRQGQPLNKEDVKTIGKNLRELLVAARARRKGIALTHSRLQRIIGAFLFLRGNIVDFEVPFSSAGFRAGKVRFDIVAEKNSKIVIVEVKDIIDKRDFGQLNFYTNILEANSVKAKVYLGLDILSLPSFLDPTMHEELIETMEREKIGVMFADKRFLAVFDDVAQYMLEKMPLFLYVEEDVM